MKGWGPKRKCLSSLPVNSRVESGPWTYRFLLRRWREGDFSGDPVVKILSFQGRGLQFRSWSENKDPSCHPERGKRKRWRGGWQNHLEHHRDGLRGCPPFTISVCLEKVFCTVGLERRVEKGTLGFRDESYVPSSQISLRVLPSPLTSPRFQFPY